MGKKKQRSASRTPLRQLARRYTSPIFARKELDSSLVKDLKDEGFWLIVHTLVNSPVTRTTLLGEPIARTLKSLAKPIPTPYTEKIGAELRWTAATIFRYASEVGEFLPMRQLFENAVLRGEYGEADKAIQCIQDRFGSSIWGLETQFLLEQKQAGFESNRKLLSGYLSAETPPWIRIFADFFSQRIEDSIPTSEYDAICNAFLVTDTDDMQGQRIRTYLRFRLNYHRFAAPEDLGYVLNFEERHSFIDRYLGFVRVVQCLLVDNSSIIGPEFASIVAAIAERTGDARLEVICGFLRPDTVRRSDAGCLIHEILHLYTLGRYAAARDVALAALKQHPGWFELYELVCKSSMRCGNAFDNPFPAGTLANQILDHTHRVVARKPETVDSLEQLLRLSYQLDSLPIGIQLFAFFRQHSSDDSPLRNDRFAAFSGTVATPRLSAAYEDHRQAVGFLTQMRAIYPSNAATELFSSTWQSISSRVYTPPAAALPPHRLCKYRAYVLETLGEFADALSAYEQLQRQNADDALLTADALTGQYRCCLRLGHILKCATILDEVAVSNPHLVSSATVKEVVSFYPSSRADEWLQNIAWPALFCAANRANYLTSDAEALHDVLDDFLSAWEARRPTDLRHITATFPRKPLVYVLRYLCVPDVLDSSIWYDSQDDLDKERMQICEWLTALDDSDREAYSAEIAELTRAATMRELTDKVHRSKIHVDAQGIVASLPQSFPDRVHRCIAFTQLKRKELRQTIELAGLADLFEQVDVVLVDSGFTQFCTLFGDLKQRFISSNEYGLDSSLSQRIRHGTLSGEIPANFETSRLVTQKDATGDYLGNSYWLDRLESGDNNVSAVVSEALTRLSQTIDATVAEVRNTWIQIKGPGNGESGMFDFDFDNTELLRRYQRVEQIEDCDSFIDYILQCLWERTEANLAEVRVAIQNDLKRKFSEALDACQESLAVVRESAGYGDFRSAVTTCKTQLAYGLDAIAEWFHLDHAQRMPDFPITALVDALLPAVNRCSGPCRLDVHCHIEGGENLPGIYFRPLWDLMFILLDNVAKHAGLESASVVLEIKRVSDRLDITIVNDLGPDVDRGALGNRVAAVQSSEPSDVEGGMVRREGGSGFFKLRKIMKYDMGCDEHALVLNMVNDERFSASLRMTLKEAKG